MNMNFESGDHVSQQSPTLRSMNVGADSPEAAAIGQVLAMATRETELHKLLADERLRSEQHKMNYQTLKAEHRRLQEEYGHLQSQMAHILDEKRHVQEMNLEALRKSKKELEQTKALIDELKGQILTPQRAELLKLEYEEEFQRKYADVLSKMEDETERYRNEYDKLRFENTVIRTEYEHDKLESERQLEALRLQFENEISRLKKENEAVRNRTASGQSQNANLVKTLQKEKLQLTRQVEGLNQELKDTRAQLEKAENRNDEAQRQLNRHLAGLSAGLKSLELEKSSLVEQCQHLQRNLQEQNEKASEVKLRFTESVIDSNRLKLQLEDAERMSKLEIGNCQEELARQKAEYETHIEKFQGHIKSLKLELENVTRTGEKDRLQRIEREKEAARRLQAARQDDLEKMKILKTEKLKLDSRCHDLERRLVEASDSNREEVSKLTSKLTAVTDNKTALEKEVLVLGMKLSNHEQLVRELESRRQEIWERQSQVHKLKADLQAMGEAEDQLVARNKELNSTLEAACREIESLRSKDDRASSGSEKLLRQQETKWDKERRAVRRKISKLEQNIKTLKQQSQSSIRMYKHKISKYGKLITKLRNRLELQEAKIQEQDIEKEVLKKSVPNDVHNTVKRQLRDLQQRHDEFRKLLHTHHLFGGEASMLPLENLASIWVFAEQELQQQHSLKAFQERLKQLNSLQSRQLEELADLKGKGAVK